MVKKKIKTIDSLNWAWQYLSPDTGHWTQFDCNDCLVLEFQHRAYTLTGKSKYQHQEIADGKVDLKEFKLVKEV